MNDRVTDEAPADEAPAPETRLARLLKAADRRRVPLLTIVTTVAIVAATYLAGKLIYRLRDIVLLILVAGFVSVLLNPIVGVLERRVVRRRGVAVGIVTLLALLFFIGLAAVFGYPLVNGITHLANRLPSYVASAQNGTGWIGHLARKYHILAWVQRNTPKLVAYAQSLSKPALSIGTAAFSLIIQLVTIFVLVLMLLLEGPKMRRWILSQMRPSRAAATTRISGEVNSAVIGYMLGNFLTSLIAGIVVFVTLLVLGVPFPQLWGLWVGLVDFLPLVGGALAGIPTVLFAFGHGITAGIVTVGRLPRLHPGREPHPESGDHEQDGEDQPAARLARRPGRRLAGQPGRRRVRRLRRGPAGHPAGWRAPGTGPRSLAGDRPGPGPAQRAAGFAGPAGRPLPCTARYAGT